MKQKKATKLSRRDKKEEEEDKIHRPLRVYLEKKTGKYYVLNKKKKTYIADFANFAKNKNRGNVKVINNIINNLAKKRREKKDNITSTLKAAVLPQVAINSSESKIFRNPNEKFNLYLPYGIQGNFNDSNQVVELSKKINEFENKNTQLQNDVKALLNQGEAKQAPEQPIIEEKEVSVIEHEQKPQLEYKGEDNLERQFEKYYEKKEKEKIDI